MTTARFNTIPSKLRTSLYDFQRDGVKFCINHSGRALIGDEMGLGKTIQAIAAAAAFREAWPVFIVVPAVVKLNWAEELEMWLNEVEPGEIHVLRGRSDTEGWKKASIKFVIATYGLFTNNSLVAKHVADHKFQFIIVDESHYMKSQNAARTQLLVPIVSQAKHAILLSGTPALARPVELYPQVSAIQPELFGTYAAFTKHFCNARRGRFGWDVSGSSNLDKLSVLLQNVMIRRKKNKVLTQLPKKIKKRVPIALHGKSVKELDQIMDSLKSTGNLVRMLCNGTGVQKTDCQANSIRNEHRRLLMRAYQLTSESKIKGVKEYVESFLNGNTEDKVIVFAHHINMLDSIEESLAGWKKRIQWMRIDGNTPHSERTQNAKKFQENLKCRVALVGMTSGGIGITLTAASHVFFAELHWTPGVLQQAEDRVHRIGQTRAVQVHYLIGRNSLDDQLWRKIVSKTNVVSTALEGKKEKLVVDMVDDLSSGQKKKKSSLKRRRYDDDPLESSGMKMYENEENENNKKMNVEERLPRGDVRSFFRNVQVSSQSSKSCLLSKKMKLASPTQKDWSCSRCTLFNKPHILRCSVCDQPKLGYSKSKSSNTTKSNNSSRKSSSVNGTPVIAKPSTAIQYSLYFSVSLHSGRIYLYDCQKRYLKVSFFPSEIGNLDSVKNPSLFEMFQADPKKKHEVKDFIDKWGRLRSIEQVNLCANKIRPPLMAEYHRIKMASTLGSGKKVQKSKLSFVRYSSKHALKPSHRKDTQNESSLTSSSPLSSSSTPSRGCVQCGTASVKIDLLPSGTCSWKCHQELAAKLSGSAIRRQIFELEKGVCVLCKRDMHALYQRFLRLQPSDRVQECMTMKLKLHDSLLQSPNEGMFWQADHILPVSEGGGECTMENIRTLCTACHQKETTLLRRRLRDVKLGESAKGTSDIRGFFGLNSSLPKKSKVIDLTVS